MRIKPLIKILILVATITTTESVFADGQAQRDQEFVDAMKRFDAKPYKIANQNFVFDLIQRDPSLLSIVDDNNRSILQKVLERGDGTFFANLMRSLVPKPRLNSLMASDGSTLLFYAMHSTAVSGQTRILVAECVDSEEQGWIGAWHTSRFLIQAIDSLDDDRVHILLRRVHPQFPPDFVTVLTRTYSMERRLEGDPLATKKIQRIRKALQLQRRAVAAYDARDVNSSVAVFAQMIALDKESGIPEVLALFDRIDDMLHGLNAAPFGEDHKTVLDRMLSEPKEIYAGTEIIALLQRSKTDIELMGKLRRSLEAKRLDHAIAVVKDPGVHKLPAKFLETETATAVKYLDEDWRWRPVVEVLTQIQSKIPDGNSMPS